MPPKRAIPQRRSARTSTSTQDGQKSRYFDGGDSDDVDMSEEEEEAPAAKRVRTAASRGRGRRPVDSDGDGDDYKEEEEKEEEEEEEEEEEDDDKAPAVTFIPNKALRDLGGIDYADDTVHPVTLAFLADLKANNRRGWLKDNDGEFRRAQRDWLSFVETLSSRISADVDDTIPELPAKDIVFRIYRDIRFSKDATPYKPHFSAAWSRTGKKGPYAHYYVHCEPGACMVGGGVWYPDADRVRLLRASIDERPHRWQRVLMDDRLHELFFGGKKVGKDLESRKKAFAAMNAVNALKKKPLGYAADHADIALLKLRNYHVHKRVPDSIFTAPDAQDRLVALLQALVPLVTLINRTVRPDPGDEDSEGGGDDDDDDDEDEDEDEDENEE